MLSVVFFFWLQGLGFRASLCRIFKRSVWEYKGHTRRILREPLGVNLRSLETRLTKFLGKGMLAGTHIISAATDPNSVGYHQPACSRFCKRNPKGNLARLKQCPGVEQAHLYGKKAVARASAKNYRNPNLLRAHIQISFCAQRFRR